MKSILILIMIILSFSIQGQKIKQNHKLQFGLNFSPDYSFRTLKNSDGSASSDIVIQSRNNSEIYKLGFTMGLNVRFDCSQSIGFETGIQFSNNGYKTKTRYLFYDPGPPVQTLPLTVMTLYSFQYVGIPVKAIFSFGKRKAHFISSIGFMTNLLLNEIEINNYSYNNGTTDKKTVSRPNEFKKIDVSPMISGGIDYSINVNTHILIEPTFRYGIIKIKDAPVSEKLWNAGLNVGIYHVIK